MVFNIKTSSGSSVDIEIHATDIPSSQQGEDRYINSKLATDWLALLADSPTLRMKGIYPPARVIARFRAALKPDTIIHTIESYSKLAHELVEKVRRHPTLGSQKGTFMEQFKETPVFQDYHNWYKNGDAEVLRYLLSFLNFGKKAEYPYEDLNQVAFHAWQSVEERLAKFVVPEGSECLREILAQILPHPGLLASERARGRAERKERSVVHRRLWAPLSRSAPLRSPVIRPKFGSGAVAEKGIRGSIRKISALRYDDLTDRAIFSGRFSLVKQLGQYLEGHCPGPNLPIQGGWGPTQSPVRSTRVARLHGVPKSYKTSRLICMEPSNYMLAQQTVLDVFSALIKGSETLRYVLDLADQSRNQRAAEFGSITGEVDTLDQASASDSVHWKLVKAVFPGWANCLLFGTRTNKVRLLDGQIIQVHKFAPMGSALCFPVQCLLFTSICIYAAFLHTRGLDASGVLPLSDELFSDVGRSFKQLFSRNYGDYRRVYHPLCIYGDDICVDHKLTQIVIDLLTKFGFEINRNKSFVGEQCFRESCGKHYMDGEDVTPLYWRVKNPTAELNEKSLPSLCAMANRAKRYGYKTLRSSIIHYLHTHGRQSGNNAILFTTSVVEGSEDGRLASAILTDVVCHRSKRGNGRPAVTERYNSDYQVWETGSIGVGEGSRVVTAKVPVTTFRAAEKLKKLSRPIPVPSDDAFLLENYLYIQWVNSAVTRRSSAIADGDLSEAAAPRRDVLNSALRWRWTPSEQ